MTADDDPLRLRVVVAAPVDRVWALLTERDLIDRWFGWEHDSLDGEIDMIFVDGVARSRQLLRFETNGGGLFHVREEPVGTVIELRRPPADGSSASVGAGDELEDGSSVGGADARGADVSGDHDGFDDIDEGWTTFVQQLRLAAERHPGEPRRAIELQGRLPGAGALPTWDALGLTDAAGLEVGDRYAVTTPFGEQLAGEVWFRSRHQLGLTVDAWGDGLLVAVERPADDDRPYGGGQLVLTSYGLGELDFAEWFQRWNRWARETYAR